MCGHTERQTRNQSCLGFFPKTSTKTVRKSYSYKSSMIYYHYADTRIFEKLEQNTYLFFGFKKKISSTNLPPTALRKKSMGSTGQ